MVAADALSPHQQPGGANHVRAHDPVLFGVFYSPCPDGVVVGPALAGNDGIVRVKSAYPIGETIERLKKDIADKGIKFFDEIDQSKLAADAGIKLQPSVLLIFGNPPLGTQFITANANAGLDWPVRLLVFENDKGEVWTAYTDFDWIARRHGIKNRRDQFKMASTVIGSITSSVKAKVAHRLRAGLRQHMPEPAAMGAASLAPAGGSPHGGCDHVQDAGALVDSGHSRRRERNRNFRRSHHRGRHRLVDFSPNAAADIRARIPMSTRSASVARSCSVSKCWWPPTS